MYIIRLYLKIQPAGISTKNYFPERPVDSIFTFEIKGDEKKAKDFIDNLELFSLLANVADVKSLVIHPATTTHSQCTPEELADQGIKQTQFVFLSVQRTLTILSRIWMRLSKQFSNQIRV